MEIKLIEEDINECLSIVTTAITELDDAAKAINSAMGELGNCWSGAAYEYTIGTYEAEYKAFLTDTVPSTVESFRDYIRKCKDTILDVDAQLSGGGY